MVSENYMLKWANAPAFKKNKEIEELREILLGAIRKAKAWDRRINLAFHEWTYSQLAREKKGRRRTGNLISKTNDKLCFFGEGFSEEEITKKLSNKEQ